VDRQIRLGRSILTLLQLTEIKTLGADDYELILTDDTGNTERVVCHVEEHKGVDIVSMQPDLVMPTWPGQFPRIDSRAVVAAVLEYHRRRLQTLPSNSRHDFSLAR